MVVSPSFLHINYGQVCIIKLVWLAGCSSVGRSAAATKSI